MRYLAVLAALLVLTGCGGDANNFDAWLDANHPDADATQRAALTENVRSTCEDEDDTKFTLGAEVFDSMGVLDALRAYCPDRVQRLYD